jgi:hypothetical protein
MSKAEKHLVFMVLARMILSQMLAVGGGGGRHIKKYYSFLINI